MLNRLRSLFSRNRFESTRKRRLPNQLSPVAAIQRLEVRNLLAGNVLASLNAAGDLSLIGDSEANAIDVVVVNGDTIVRGRDNTTINGAATPFTAATGGTTIADDFFANLGAGDDVLFVEGVAISGRASVSAGAGNNSIGFSDSSVGSQLDIRTSRGMDVISVDTVQIGRDFNVRTSSGNDTIRVFDTIIGDDARIITGRHNDAVVLNNATIADNMTVRTGAGSDDLVLTNSTVSNRLRAVMGRHHDFVLLDGSNVNGRMILRTGAGNDRVATANTGQIGRLRANTGGGTDSIEIATTTTVVGRNVVRRQEGGTVSATVRDTELNAAITGALTRSTAAETFFAALSTATPLSLTVDTSTDAPVQSSGTLVTTDQNFDLEVATQPGATVAVDSDGDGQFDDGTATADATGNAVLSVALTRDATTNDGTNVINVQASNGTDTPLTEQIDIYFAQGTVVRFDSSLGFWDVELFDDDAPNTVGAFLGNLTGYQDTIIHRNVSDFIVQGGGFEVNGTAVTNAPSFAAPTNESVPAESIPEHSNLRGTISTAQTSNVNSFTGQWFFNTVDNIAGSAINNLDSVPHTAFGRVIGTGMTVVDAINTTPDFSLTSLLTNASALTDTPLVNYTAGSVPTPANFVTINSVTTISTPAGTENTFGLTENSAAGTTVGTITTATPVTAPVIYELEAPAVANELRLNPDDHLEGDAAAPVVLVEYISLQCPACAAAQPVIQQLLADNADDVVVVRRHLPNDTSNGGGFEHSFEAALAAEAAGRQGQFNEMVNELLARQSEWTNNASSAAANAVFEDIATNTLNLNITQFRSDVADQALTDRINRDITDAAALNANGTPTFFLNGSSQILTTTPTSADIQSALQSIDPTFSLNRRTGEIRVIDSADLDFETTPSFTLDITANDGTQQTVQATINLRDVANA